MIFLFTGVPGASKTINALEFVDTDDRFKNRPVYYFDIAECLMSGWNELTLDQLKDWQKLPHGSVIIIDESYKFAPVGKTGVPPEPFIEALAEHRHLGMDIIFICQHPHQIHTFVRKMVNNHFHFERQFGFKRVRRLEWQKCVPEPDDYFARKLAVTTSKKINQKYFGKYKSAEIHTHAPKIPRKLVFIILLGIAVITGLFGFMYHIKSRADVGEVSASGLAADALSAINGGTSTNANTFANDPVAAYLPRVPDQPWTAPVYDKLTAPKTFPKPSCVENLTKGTCRCYSQQGTRLEMSINACKEIVKYGWFDHTKEERERDNQRDRSQAQRLAERPAPDLPVESATFLPDSTYYRVVAQ